MSEPSDTWGMPFVSTIRIPSEVVGAIVSLTELTVELAVESALEVRRLDAVPATADGPFTVPRP